MRFMKQTALLFILLFTAVMFYACSKENNTAAADATTGKGGSLARFTITGNYLYAVSNHNLFAYSLTQPGKPELVYTSPMNFDIETIYPYNNYLFLGTKTGLYIYSLAKPEQPEL